MTTLDTLIGSNAGFGNIVKTIQSGGAYIDPKGRVLSKTELKPLPTYYGGGAVFTIRDQAYSYDENGSMIPVPREPLEIYKFDVAGDGKFTVPKLRNEKEGGYFKDITLNATKSGNGFTIENTDKAATGQYFQPLKGTDFSNQQWVGMSRGLSNINSAVQSGEATIASKPTTETYWDDAQGKEITNTFYKLLDGNGNEVGRVKDVPGRDDIKFADVGNEAAGGGHYVFLQTDPKTGRVAPIQDFGAQVTYNPSQGKGAFQLIGENIKAAAPYAAMIFGGPLAGELGGGLLGAAGSSAIFQAAAGVPIEKMAENIATSTLTAGALGASGVDLAGAAGGGVTGTMAANTAANLLQGKTVDQALTNAAISTAISTGANTIAENQAADYIQNLAIPDYLNVDIAPTSADVIAAYPETNPNLVDSTLSNLTSNQVDTALNTLTGGYTLGGTTEGITATLPITTVTGTEPIDYAITPNVTVNDVVKDIVIENLNTNLQNGTLTADQVDTALATLTGDYTLSGTTEGIKATLPDTIVSGTEPVDYALNVLTGGEGLTLPTSPNLDVMGGGQGLTANVDGGVLSEEGLTRTGDVVLGNPNSFINTTLPLTTELPAEKPITEEQTTPYTKEQIEAMIKLAVLAATATKTADVITDAISSGGDTTTKTGFPYIPSDISDWARPVYTKTWQAPIDLNSIFSTDNLLGGTQWAGLQGNQFSNIPQVSMSDFISSIQNGKV